MASRSLDDLHPDVRDRVARWVALCKARGVDVLVYCTFRSADEQDELYSQGRTKPGRIVTNARAWSSWHNVRRAIDAVPVVFGKPDWSYSDVNNDKVPDELWWQVMVEEADRVGLEWSGRWKRFPEYVHWQFTGGLSIEQARAQMEAGR